MQSGGSRLALWLHEWRKSYKELERSEVRRRIVLMEAYTLHGFINYYLFLAGSPIITDVVRLILKFIAVLPSR